MPEPFRVTRGEDGSFRGLGVTDDKGSLAAALLAITELKRRGGTQCRFAVACTSDEESGFLGVESILPEILSPDAAIVMEGTCLDIVTAHKGTVRWKITTRGVSVHSSLVPQGENAIYKAARIVLALEELGKELIGRPQHKRLRFPTLSVGTIHGGTQPNSVPDRCEIMIDRRLLPTEHVSEAEAEIRRALEGVADFELSEPTLYSAAFEIEEDAPFVREMLEEAGGSNRRRKSGGSTAPRRRATREDSGFRRLCSVRGMSPAPTRSGNIFFCRKLNRPQPFLSTWRNASAVQLK